MIEPNYVSNHSLMENKVQICGNIELEKTLKLIVKEKCINFVDLYEAQEIMRRYCVDNYGTDFYEKNAEAILFILENEYCNIERIKLPLFDMKRYLEDIQNGTIY